jgi:hypothetical protein
MHGATHIKKKKKRSGNFNFTVPNLGAFRTDLSLALAAAFMC